MSCSGTIQNLERFWIRSEDVSNDVQGLGEGLERFGGSGAARTVELWGVRADVWGLAGRVETSGGFGGSLGGRLVWHVSKP